MSATGIEDLGTIPGIQGYLRCHSRFAAHTVEKLSGGMGNFTYRIHLLRAFDGHQTLVLKYAPPYFDNSAKITYHTDNEIDQLIEVEALHIAGRLSMANVPAFIKIPAVHLFDEERHVIIMDDAGTDCKTLKKLLIEGELSRNVSEQIGTALGQFICGVHTWNQNPDVDLTRFADYQMGKYVSAFVTYGQIESTLSGKDKIPALSDPLLGVPEAKMMTISKLVKQRQQAIYAASTSDPTTHGDFWPGNLVLSFRRGVDGSVEGVEKLYILDWELCKTGLPGLDLGQLCAELYILSEFYPARKESALAMIASFLGAYRRRRGKGGDAELARVVASHIGAHAVAFTPRISSWSGREKIRDVVKEGVEMLVLGEKGSETDLKASIVGPLL